MSRGPARLAADDRVGTRFGEYQIESLIGVGGMGKVYKATAGDGTSVALKIVKRDFARDETFRRRFRREARIAQTVRNPHVVPVRDTGEHDGLPYLTAQFIEGTTLDQKLEQEGRLDLATTVRICSQVADGLQALWKAGMVHRDVKPANILLDLTGKRVHHGLRPRQGQRRDDADATGPAARIDGLHAARADPGRAGDRRGRRLLARMRRVRVRVRTGHRSPTARGWRVLWAHLQDEPPDPSARPHRRLARVHAGADGRAAQGARRPTQVRASSMPVRSQWPPASRSRTRPADPGTGLAASPMRARHTRCAVCARLASRC